MSELLPIQDRRHFKNGLKNILSSYGSSLVPRPRPAFRRFQYGKAGEGLE